MAKPKFDYNGDAFYDEIEQLAKQGQKDSEIAYALGLKFDVVLSFEEIKDLFPIMENSLPKYENDLKQVLLAIKGMGQLEVAKIWHEDDWGDGFVEDFCKTHDI